MDEPSPPQDSQAQGRSKSRGRRRGGAVRSKKSNRTATAQAMSQPLSSQKNNSQPNKAKDDIDPNNETVKLPPNEQGVRSTRLLWSGPMESMMMDLYIQAVERGKRSDSGFQSSTHKHVTRELEKNFPEVAHCITDKKVKSKLSQGFKRDYKAFLALKNASGFGWDDITGVATASTEVWERYLGFHPYARKFWGSPFPEFHKLDLIFGDIRATGPTAYLSRSHSKKDAIANALDGLVGFLQNSRSQSEQRQQQQAATTSSPSVTNLQLAMSLYQEVHAEEASQHEALSAFKIFRSDTNAQIFTSIREKNLRLEWLHQQIDEMNN
ncbi:hypothetical protein Pst134EA_011217 [Puccinia striiformis f. sp. tritici]|uniref:hypothetical protein n=1 Tax=Puccinia striiformis f. sp. tritici TaxID=168172 RepID=UPI00200830C9|nr:hypothetical protein Pst134EA_011217 [Puccinia striiformis f. sp. tritici]KAH9467577.1 hypothetical protein Pst134EA_011217 [Puccinia striiformis f. sp. tritici]